MKVLKDICVLSILAFYYFILLITAGSPELYFAFDFFLCIVLPIILFALPIVLIFFVKKRGRLFSIVLSFMFLFMYTSVMAVFNHYAIIEQQTFSTEKWQSSKYCEHRHYIIDDLKCKHSFVGMTRNEVDRILGDISDSKCSYDFQRDNKICFFSRNVPYFGEFEYFCLYFDDNNIVTKTEVEIEYEPTINYDKLELELYK